MRTVIAVTSVVILIGVIVAGAVVCFAIHRLNTVRLAAHPELVRAQ